MWYSEKLQQEWLEHYDPQTGDVYFFNEKLNKVESHLPSISTDPEPTDANIDCFVYKEGTIHWGKYDSNKKV